MIFTFPHLGNTYIIAKSLLDDFDAKYVVPPFNSNKTLQIGAKYSQEMNCLPFKLFIGNMMQAYEMGADTFLITGGCGPCKLGYFGEMLKKTIKDIGINMEVITLEKPDSGIVDLAKMIKKCTGTLNVINLAMAVNNAKKIAIKVDELEKLMRLKRCREQNKGSVNKICKEFHSKVIDKKGSKNILDFIDETKEQLNKLPINADFEPLRIGVVGEIYTTVEPYANFRLEELLGNMGVEVERKVTVSDWIIGNIIRKKLHLPTDTSYVEASKDYLGRMVGGHARHTVGNSVLHAKDGYDGVIHMYPLACMPEIVSQSILPTVEDDFGMPIMTIIRDEMTGETGFETRIEAFIDLLKKRRVLGELYRQSDWDAI